MTTSAITMLLLGSTLAPTPSSLSLRTSKLYKSLTSPPLPSKKTISPWISSSLSSTASVKSSPLRPLLIPFLSSPLSQIAPFIRPEWDSILKGWVSGAVAVCCLSAAVPKLGRLPTALSAAGSDRMAAEGLTLAALALLRAVTSCLQQVFLWEAALGCSYRIRTHVFDRVLQRDLGFFEGSDGVPAGDIAHRIIKETDDVADTVYILLSTSVPNTLQLVAMGSRMVAVSPVLALGSALVIPCLSLIITYLGERLRNISRKAQLSAAKLSAYLNEVLPAMLIVKANNGELIESLRFQRLAHIDLVALLKKRRMKAVIPQILQVIFMGGLLVLCAAFMIFSKSSFDCSRFIPFIMSLVLLIDPIQGVGRAYNELKQGEPAIERLFDLARFDPEVTEKPDAVEIANVKGDIKFCGVTFKYGENMPLVLSGLDLHIKPGENVALIGPSGGGKTTLSKLLLRLYDPLCGRILIDGQDIQQIRLKSLREHIMLVSQDSMLFSGSVAENIGYRNSFGKIDMKRVENAARIAHADKFINMLPKGYETNVGQRGSLLSGGQKQRIAIARALYQQPSVLILDEATCSLDSRSELLVRQALERLMANRTVLVIAHRLETILTADRVLLLDGAKLQEVPKSSLFAQDGPLASMRWNKLVA